MIPLLTRKRAPLVALLAITCTALAAGCSSSQQLIEFGFEFAGHVRVRVD